MLIHSPRATELSTRLSLASSVFAFRRVDETDEIDFPRRRSFGDIFALRVTQRVLARHTSARLQCAQTRPEDHQSAANANQATNRKRA